MDVGFVFWGNMIEGAFWAGVSLFFFVPALRRREEHRAFCVSAGIVFLVWGGSDFCEAYTGAWWRPWWLMVWNGLCLAGCVGIGVWYAKLHSPLRAHLRSLKPLRLPLARGDKRR